MYEVGREQGVLTSSVVFSTVHEVGREQGVLTISVVFSTVYEVGREQGVLIKSNIQIYVCTYHPWYFCTRTKLNCMAFTVK